MNLKFWKHKQDPHETLTVLKLVKGQTLIGVTVNGAEWQLHFPDFVVFVENPYPSPIIERIPQ